MGILIVEDSVFQARILADLLKPLGSALFVAASVREAHDILQTVQISLVIADLCMPDKEDGMGLIRELLATPSTRPTPVVFVCSANDNQKTRAELCAMGVRRIFVKPYNANEMQNAVREIFWCGQPKSTDDAAYSSSSVLKH